MTRCNLLQNQKAQYLDRHHLSCPANYAIRQFTVTRSGCSGNNMRYQYTCEPVRRIVSYSTRYSSCQLLKNYQMQYLDRQNVHCRANEVITGFYVQGCGGRNMRYRIRCGAVRLKRLTRKYSGCQLLDRHNAQYLDRQNPKCGASEFIFADRFGACRQRTPRAQSSQGLA